MCLMLYVGTAEDLPMASSADLKVEDIDNDSRLVAQWFSHPAVKLVCAHGSCSCGFPSVSATSPIEHYEGMPLDSSDREADLRSVRALLELLEQTVAGSSGVELYPVWNGEESLPPKGVIEWRFADLRAEHFFFNERFMHIVRR